ncbi:hypothetical protein LCGC14_0406750 [marine sediment metagenome]|uniref:Uncharacterized protein n=1 Tax=marine sediment metagenome TaxID=412755 RepID=A0A0F9SV19_9ZZZZ
MREYKKGDLVEWKDSCGKLHRGFVLGTDNDWWVIKKHLDINNYIISLSSIRNTTKREEVKEYWKYLRSN